MIPRLASLLRRTGRVIGERPRATAWTLVALACALLAVAAGLVTAQALERWAAARPGAGASMVVYLADGVDEARAQGLAADLARLPGVERAELVPAAESARRLQLALGADAALLEGVEVGSLPASVEVTLAPGVADVVAMSPTVRALRGAEGVDDVIVEDAGDERAVRALAAVRLAAWAAAALFGGLALIIVLAALRVRLDRSANELAVAALLGAGPGFFAVPTALAGAALGVLGAGLAAGALLLGLGTWGDAVVRAAAEALGPAALAAPLAPAAVEIVAFVGAGGLLGLVAGALAGAARVRG